MPQDPVTHDFDAATGIARITFDRPDVLNAIDLATARAFGAAVAAVTGFEGLRCIVLAGAGRAFIAGGDVASFGDEPAEIIDALLEALHPPLLALRACAAPVLAVVQGAAAGGGLSIALGADYLLASDKARFVIAYDRIGAAPDCGGTWFLARKLGRTRAFAMVLRGEALDAQAALEAGLVSEVVPQAELAGAADRIRPDAGLWPVQAADRQCIGRGARRATGGRAQGFPDRNDNQRLPGGRRCLPEQARAGVHGPLRRFTRSPLGASDRFRAGSGCHAASPPPRAPRTMQARQCRHAMPVPWR
jgi:2-(1,2-epoxy-1,2-dihydrophenyl)acetyl-CoA isomerase